MKWCPLKRKQAAFAGTVSFTGNSALKDSISAGESERNSGSSVPCNFPGYISVLQSYSGPSALNNVFGKISLQWNKILNIIR